jgi:signal transduction histidine kinase
VSVALEADQNRLCMQIHDNGRGFDPRVVPSERLGIRIMRERAGSLGGQLTIQSSEENGTTVRVDVPRSAWQ